MRPNRRCVPCWAAITATLALSACTSGSSSPPQPADPALRVPATVPAQCTDNPVVRCSLAVPGYLRDRPIHLRALRAGESCPTSSGTLLRLPNATGVAVGGGPVKVIVPQAGDLTHGRVILAPSDVPGWQGIKTHWVVRPSYGGWVVVRGKRLDGSGPVALLGEAAIGPLLIQPGSGPNDSGGWREQPSGTYVRTAGCYGFQVDGATFSYSIVLQAVNPSPAS